jgi:DNA-binding beta-propeller fold protein YncE
MRIHSFLVALVVIIMSALPFTLGDGPPAIRPGALGDGVTLLPNGWKIAPAGQHVQVGSFPLAMVESPDGRYLFITNNGYLKPSITVVDIKARRVADTLVLDHAWLGLAWHPDGKRLYASGAGNNTVHELRWERRQLPPPVPEEDVTPSPTKAPPVFTMALTRGDDLVLGRPMPAPANGSNRPERVPQSFIGGIAVAPDGSRLFAVHVLGQLVSAVDLKTGHVLQSIALPAEPYTCLLSADGTTLFVSLWGGARVLMFDAWSLAPKGEVAVGEHPNAMALTHDGKRLFVACANTNAVWVVDVAKRQATEQVKVSIYPDAPPGSTPNSVSLSADETRLLVANADNNTVAVVDVSDASRSVVQGFIPTGWYPTAALVSRDNAHVFVLSGKGLTSSANPRYMPRSLPGGDMTYVGAMLTGTLSVLPNPDASQLRELTTTARSVTRYSDDQRLTPAGPPSASPIPRRVGDPSPIKHVFYVIRENRTFDQVLGDLGRGNGDPTLTLFGEDVTPNVHALAREFGVLDNFYVDAEVSYDGHAFSLGAYATDLVEKFWPTNYASRGAVYLSEGGGSMRNAYGNIAAPMNGYLWDAAARHNVSYRSYGEFAHWAPGTEDDRVAGKVKAVASVPGLVGHINESYPPWDLSIPDNRRLDAWEKEFASQVAQGQVPALSIVRLGNDHTNGTRPGTPTPRAMVAENDLAVGRLVDVISHSAVWKGSAIFILEDDAQSGPDHIDAHRSPALVVSPFSRRRAVDSTMYSTSALLRTMELILGLPPMSQYDASATPMYNAMQATPDLQPFVKLSARTSIDEKNDHMAYGADASMRMNLAEADMAPERELNEILWRSIKGTGSAMPPAVRSAFVRPARALDSDDDDRR